MDREEALSVAQEQLAELRQPTYAELVDRLLDKEEHDERLGASGARYSVESQAFWDDKEHGNLRVMVSVDDGGWRAFAPLSVDFIRSPDGSFVGE